MRRASIIHLTSVLAGITVVGCENGSGPGPGAVHAVIYGVVAEADGAGNRIAPVAGVNVALRGTVGELCGDGTFVRNVTTDADGKYRFALDTVTAAFSACLRITVTPAAGSPLETAVVDRAVRVEDTQDSVRVDVTLPRSPAAVATIIMEPVLSACRAGAPFIAPLRALVVDGRGQPMAGHTVVFGVLAGGGSIDPSGVTNASGIVTVNFICGSKLGIGAHIIRAASGRIVGDMFIDGQPGYAGLADVTFIPTIIESGEAILPLVLNLPITDMFGNTVPVGTGVDWAIEEGGGTLAGSSSPTYSTGMSGGCPHGRSCSINYWTPDTSTHGIKSIRLTSPDSPAFSQLIGAWVIDGPPQILGDPSTVQSVPVNSTLTTPLQVQLRDGNGAALQGVPIDFSSRGGTLTPVGGTARKSAIRIPTDADGKASVRFNAGSSAGGFDVTAHILSATTISDMACSPCRGPINVGWGIEVQPVPPAAVQIVSGNNQTAGAARPLTDSLVARVVDATGAPLGGVGVTWVVTSGDGFIAPVTMTNADGYVRNMWTLGLQLGSQTVTATAGSVSAMFTATAVP